MRQNRIVAKVKELLGLCDELESKIKESESEGENLMEAIVQELTAA